MNMAAGEECDDIESWEEMEDLGVLDKKIDKLKAAMSKSTQKDLSGSTIATSVKPDTVVIIAEDGRTRYSAPEPTVKILKRPSIVNSSHNAGGDGFIVNGDGGGKPKQPIKTLQQREMEYAEARLRILGEAQSPDERPALLERIRRIQNKAELGNELVPTLPSGIVVDHPCGGVGVGNLTPPPGVAPSAVHVAVGPPPPMPHYAATGVNNHIQQQSPGAAPSQQQLIIITSSAAHLPPPTGTAMVCGGSGMSGLYSMVANAHGQPVYDNGYSSKMAAGAYVTAFNCQPPPIKCAGGLVGHQALHGGGYNATPDLSTCGAATHSVPPMYSGASTGGYMNHHQIHHHAAHHHSHLHHASLVAPSGVGNNHTYMSIPTPISLNLAIRQPRGPDGTKGFNNYRNTLR